MPLYVFIVQLAWSKGMYDCSERPFPVSLGNFAWAFSIYEAKIRMQVTDRNSMDLSAANVEKVGYGAGGHDNK